MDILGYHLQTRLSQGGLIDAWRRMAIVLSVWYEQIAGEARGSAVLHADETGWRINGQTCWLWCFANAQVCYYMIDRSRGSPALQAFFTDAFDGTPVYSDADTLRLSKRLRRHWDHLFTFLDKPEVPFENNLAERAIRPAVIPRKAGQSNRSEQGAATQSVLMTVFCTLKLRGLDPISTVTASLRTYIQTGELPPLPQEVVADG